MSELENDHSIQGQTIIVNQQSSKSNGVGTAGFVLSLIAIALCWIPVLDWILWILGLILSFAGVFKAPRGLAVAGLVISLVCLLIIILVIGAIGAALSVL